jgi:hypothetical protein
MPQDAEALQQLRGEIQREFKGNRKKNAFKFATYIRQRALGGHSFSLPPIALWTPEEVACDVMELREGTYRLRPLGDSEFGALGLATVYLDPTALVIAIDGETQTAALFCVLDALTETQDAASKKTLDQLPLDVQFHFNCDSKWAHHAFNTRNREGVKQTGLTLGASESDPHMWVVRSLLDANPHLKDFIDVKARQGSPARPLTGSALMQFVRCLQVGIIGTQKGKAPTDLEGEELERLRQQSLQWFEALTQALGDNLYSPACNCSAPQVLAALGALGHDVLRATDPARQRSQEEVLSRLRKIDWSKGSQWLDVAGKRAADGKLSVGGGATVYAQRTYAAIAGDAPEAARKVELNLAG